jgi:hypothetical protein
MIITGLTLACLIYGGVVLLFKRLPRLFQKGLLRLNILLDIVISVGTFFALGKTVTALIASAFIGLFVSATLAYAKVADGIIRRLLG